MPGRCMDWMWNIYGCHCFGPEFIYFHIMLTPPSLALSQFLVFCDLQSCEALALDERCSSEARNSRTLPGATTLARNSERLLNLAKKKHWKRFVTNLDGETGWKITTPKNRNRSGMTYCMLCHVGVAWSLGLSKRWFFLFQRASKLSDVSLLERSHAKGYKTFSSDWSYAVFSASILTPRVAFQESWHFFSSLFWAALMPRLEALSEFPAHAELPGASFWCLGWVLLG